MNILSKINNLFGTKKKSLTNETMFYNMFGKYGIDYIGFQNNYKLIELYSELVEVKAIIDYISLNRSKIKYELWLGTEENPIKKVEKHPIIDILNKPNQYDSLGELRKKLVVYKKLLGNSYLNALKPVGFSQPSKLFVLPTQNVKINVTDVNDYRLSDVVNYQYTYKGNQITISKDDILHIKETNVNNIDNELFVYGQSPIISAKLPLTSLKAAYSAKTQLYQHGARAILTSRADGMNQITPQDADKELNRLNNKYGLTEGQYQFMISHLPLDVIPISHSVSELQINENNLADYQALCKCYNIPSIILNDNSNSTYNNIREAKTQVWFGNFIPEEQDLSKDICQFLLELFGETKDYFIKLDLSSIEDIKESTNEQSERIINQYNSGIISLNEAREKLGYDILQNDNFNTQNNE